MGHSNYDSKALASESSGDVLSITWAGYGDTIDNVKPRHCFRPGTAESLQPSCHYGLWGKNSQEGSLNPNTQFKTALEGHGHCLKSVPGIVHEFEI